MDPVSLALTAVAAGVTAYGKYEEGQAQSAEYTYRAGVAQALAKVAENNANWDFAAGEVKAGQAGLRGRAEAGRQVVTAGAGNIDVTKGSPSKIADSINEISVQNQGIERADAAHAAYSERVQASTETATAGLDLYAASTSREAGDISAIGSIVGGATSVASKWQQASTIGLFGSGSAATTFPDPNNPGGYAPGYG